MIASRLRCPRLTRPSLAEPDVAAFVTPFREDFGAAVDRCRQKPVPGGADGALVDRVAADMAAAPLPGRSK